METQAIEDEIQRLKQRVNELETQKSENLPPPDSWVPQGHYAAYEAAAGFMLGVFGAVVSLMFNVIGSVIAQKDSLQLIRVYLTFPLGEKALNLSQAGGQTETVPDGLILALGCCLYLGTGMLLGVPVFMAVNRFGKGLVPRIVIGVCVSLLIWAINFYGVLSWLQPMFFGGDWITSGEYLPWWVAAATHAVFGATIGILAPWGEFSSKRTSVD